MTKIDRNRINDVIEDMCDHYCMWPEKAVDDYELEDVCDNCPLNNIVNDDYWEERENG